MYQPFIVSALVFLLTVCSTITFAQKDTDKPNIIFIFADDLGWGDLSCYGNNRIKTPALDKLASEGTLFTQFYVAGSVCSPSRAGIMTGQYPARNRIFGHFTTQEGVNERRGMPDYLDSGLPMLTDLLKETGYTTAHFGKWHLGTVTPSEYGVDVFRTDNHTNIKNSDPVDIWSPEARPHCTQDILNDALEFIKQAKGQPFYANVWLSDVHATLNPSEEQLKEVRKFKPRMDVPFYGVEQVYYAALLEMDHQIGIFLDELDSMGVAENTLIIFSSDNGPEDYQISNAAHSGVGSAGPFRGRKRSIYEGGIRVPFILRWPGSIPASKVNDASVINGVDFLPTICRIVEVELPNALAADGEDMSDVWLGADRNRTQPLFWEWRFKVFGHVLNRPPQLAVRDGDWKLLMNPDRSRVELYNIPKDPSELNNLADQESEIVNRLSRMLLEWNATLPESPVDEVAGQNTYPWPE